MDLHSDLMTNVKKMTSLIIVAYDNLQAFALKTGDYMQVIEELKPLITVHNMYINYIKDNNYCKAPILRVQKLLASEFEKFVVQVHNQQASKLELVPIIINICNLGKQYAHKTKFTVMAIPADSMDLQPDC